MINIERIPIVIKITDALISITKLDWKAYVLGLVGFLGGAFSNELGERYGIAIGMTVFMVSWWLVLAGLTIAHKKADLPIYKIGGTKP
jgi:hypothetical protein